MSMNAIHDALPHGDTRSAAESLVAIVTGAGDGIGWATSERLADDVSHVVLVDLREDAVVRRAAQLGSAHLGLRCDVSSPEDIAGVIRTVVDRFGHIDVLVNNAGIGMRTVNRRFMTDPQPFWTVEPDRFRDLFATNVTGYFLLARAVAPVMAQAGKGKIINVSVSEATTRRAGFAPYGPSRAATDSLSHVMAADLAGTGVTVNLLAPGGGTATGMIPEEVGEDVRAGLLDPAIMGPPIRWLASADSDGITDCRVIATEFADGVRPTAGKS
jgi:gluconate 5-dehydrogenase